MGTSLKNKMYRGKTITVTLTIPAKQAYRLEPLKKVLAEGYDFTVTENPSPYYERKTDARERKVEEYRKQKEKNITFIRFLASELDVLTKTNKREKVAIRTSLVYFLRDKFTGPTIAEALDYDNSFVPACIERY